MTNIKDSAVLTIATAMARFHQPEGDLPERDVLKHHEEAGRFLYAMEAHAKLKPADVSDAPPKAEAVKADPPKTEAVKVDHPKAEAAKADPPKASGIGGTGAPSSGGKTTHG